VGVVGDFEHAAHATDRHINMVPNWRTIPSRIRGNNDHACIYCLVPVQVPVGVTTVD